MAMPVQGPCASVPVERAPAKLVVGAALDDGPEGLRGGRPPVCPPARQRLVRCLAAVQPAQGALHAVEGQLVRRLARDHVVERHGDVGAERPLDLHGALGRQRAVGAVDVRLELDAVLADPAEPFEREHLEAARIGEHGPPPGGEPVEPAHVADDLLAGTEVQVVGVAQDDLRAGALDVAGAQAADHAVGADRHEGRGLDGAVGQRERAGPGVALRGVQAEPEHRGRRRRRARRQRITIASPYE